MKDSLLNSEKNTVQKAGVIKAKNTFVATFKYCACSSSSKPNNCKIYFVSSEVQNQYFNITLRNKNHTKIKLLIQVCYVKFN